MEAWNGVPSGTDGRMNGYIPQLATKTNNMADEPLGFSHGAFALNNQNAGGFGNRQTRRGNVPAINTGAVRGGMSDMGTPGTAIDMHFSPLLPSQLLLGSPFQPGSPSTFASPRFSSFGPFAQQNSGTHGPARQNHGPGADQSMQHPTSPHAINSFLPSAAFGASQMLSPQSPVAGYAGLASQGIGIPQAQVMPALMSGTSRTVYLGNIPAETSAEEILNHVRSGQIESVRLLPDKNCAFISFLDGSSATHFHSDAILKKLSIRGNDIKVGWGKPSHVPTSVALTVQQSGASRNVYLGNLPENITEQELREDLGKFGSIDTVKIVREKSIAFVHFLSIGNAIKAVSHLPQESKWQPPRRVFYGKDRCAYVSKTQQQNAAQFLGIAPGYAHILNGADRELISNAIAQQSVAAAAVATSAGGLANLGNRTAYLGNIHPETTLEEICNVVRGGLLHHVRYIPDKHICFVTFIDPTSAASFYALSQIQGLMIHNRRLKIGWGKHSGALPPAIALAVSGGASRNVYVGNLDESWTEERLRQDFAEYGEIELVNTLREKSCAFVNFTNIANAIKAIEGIRGRDEYRRFKINFGKDRCGNPPRQTGGRDQHKQQQHSSAAASNGVHESLGSPQAQAQAQAQAGLGLPSSRAGSSNSHNRGDLSPGPGVNGVGSGHSQKPSLAPSQQQRQQQQNNNQHQQSGMLHGADTNPLTMYLSQLSLQQQSQSTQQVSDAQMAALSYQQNAPFIATPTTMVNMRIGQAAQPYLDANGVGNGGGGKVSSSPWTVGGLLAPSNADVGFGLGRSQHARAISLPVFSQEQGPNLGHARAQPSVANNSSFGSFGAGGAGSPYGLAIQPGSGGLSGWTEEEVVAQ